MNKKKNGYAKSRGFILQETFMLNSIIYQIESYLLVLSHMEMHMGLGEVQFTVQYFCQIFKNISPYSHLLIIMNNFENWTLFFCYSIYIIPELGKTSTIDWI